LPMTNELEKFYSLIEDIKIAMLTTRRADGHLRSRAMANQKKASGADLWFVTAAGSGKLDDIAQDPHVNLSYFKDSSTEWISVSGIAEISHDRQKIYELYEPDWKLWFGEEGDPRHGTKDDPRFVLIGVKIHAAEFLEVNKPKPVVLYEMVKGWVTGKEPEIGEMHHLKEPHRPNA
jgi:general stress protein 26